MDTGASTLFLRGEQYRTRAVSQTQLRLRAIAPNGPCPRPRRPVAGSLDAGRRSGTIKELQARERE
jgi:hypothetical protein